ncbi:phytoene/squalene synthase family protein [Chitinophaga sancti]|uniref:Phytoene/squalene synthase family protein n=1 Tax=Chitinophaga sancti TaxID=1004 RepID=A0A1K1SGN8_9BACT|nr:phytoene/squalene synthase family protein [Chitinophaga sancti]WQD59882.1 phytoene/squalene synthase family protein [Chitinophaga sancti]WQG87987.1 phytoene/squalene synthase family protein [Chitinophaga sancti]SFW83426.1 Phytoene/squalene synthetase [Chitinophaga sancti]
MKLLFDKLSAQCSKLTTEEYSTSFSLGIRLLNKKFHAPIYAIYGFVRFADEIVDSFHDYDKAALLRHFREETYRAIKDRISLNPILNSFQQVFHDYNIEQELVDTFLDSMEMDLHQHFYTRSIYEQYILGSAEVVGLMCLKVFTENNHDLYCHLRAAAMKLGAAFQKVNFLRDVKADSQELGRHYFPLVNLNDFTNKDKSAIESEIANDFREALPGIMQLPLSSRKGVYLAYTYYQVLFKKIKSLPAQRIMTERIRVPNTHKIGIMLQTLFFPSNLIQQ